MASQGVVANSRLAEMQKGQKHNQDFWYADNSLQFKLNESWAGRRLAEALSHLPPTNLSSSLDSSMKFQKKQMLEREQKKLALVEGDFSQPPKNIIGNGKVRQMFDDRRRGVVGVDRSHPLRPIATSTTTTNVTTRTTTQQPATNKRLVGGGYVARRPGLSNTSLLSTTNTRNIFKNNSSPTNGNMNLFESNLDEIDNIDNESFPKEFSMLSLNHTYAMGSFAANNNEFENNNIQESSILGGTTIINKKNISKSNGFKLNPVITKKSPTTATALKTNSRSPSSSSRASVPSHTKTSSIKSSPSKAALTTNKNIKTSGNKTKPATFILAVKPPPKISTPPPGMASCTHCQRHFSEERLSKHEEVCRKMMSKKRKIFDASQHRVKGTEAEKYLKKGKVSTTTATKGKASAIISPQAVKTASEKKSNWRKTHEEFITAIREAKKVQAYLAKGGKLSDLPPPPPSENPDYIQCPHCGRRFNESAAERHIPKCANMQHNKPKPTKKRF